MTILDIVSESRKTKHYRIRKLRCCCSILNAVGSTILQLTGYAVTLTTFDLVTDNSLVIGVSSIVRFALFLPLIAGIALLLEIRILMWTNGQQIRAERESNSPSNSKA